MQPLSRGLSLLQEAVTLELWACRAIEVNLSQPYRLVSGNYSPIYIDCRRVISFPFFMQLFCTATASLVRERGLHFDIVAGGETAGIPFASFVAQHFYSPLVYVRKSKKAHGLQSQIEGVLAPQARVLLVEDLITDASSKRVFIDALRDAGQSVDHVLVIFDREQGGKESLARDGVCLHSLSDLSTALAVAEAAQLLSKAELSEVRTYFQSPAAWHRHMNLTFQ